jgi:hypothetical protein
MYKVSNGRDSNYVFAETPFMVAMEGEEKW